MAGPVRVRGRLPLAWTVKPRAGLVTPDTRLGRAGGDGLRRGPAAAGGPVDRGPGQDGPDPRPPRPSAPPIR